MAKLTGVKTIDMVGGEITKVEYNGELYAKVEGDAKEGDLLLATISSLMDVNPGDFFAVKSEGEYFDNNDDKRDANHAGLREYYRYFRKESTQAPSQTHSLESRVKTLEKKVAAIEGPKEEPLKVGDYAKVVGDYGGESHRVSIGTIVKITDTDSDYNIRYPFEAEYLNGNDTGSLFHVDDLVKATEEEVAEAQAKAKEAERWAAIGRKPNEYKKGDIVHADRDDAEFTVLSVDEILSGVVSFESRRVRLEDVGLVVPVESRFDQ